MSSSVRTSGIAGTTHRTRFRKEFLRTKPKAIGLAVAYVSVSGLKMIQSIFDEGDVDDVRLVTDTKDAVTHPKALQAAMDSGWDVRVVDSLSGTFHPKLYLGGEFFTDNAELSKISLVVAGSSNLSYGGFSKNGECSFWSTGPGNRPSVQNAWLECWQIGTPLTVAKLTTYEQYFALRNRNRSPADLLTLGVADQIPQVAQGGVPKKGVTGPKAGNTAVSDSVASVAWAGLQSFTGEYNLQVEFPKEAGLVLNRLFGGISADGSIEIVCSDGIERIFKFRYYSNNGMFRLNIPNIVPLVDWARGNKAGIAYIEQDAGSNGIYFEIIPPGSHMIDVVERSLALGTWGRTPTRLYGWY